MKTQKMKTQKDNDKEENKIIALSEIFLVSTALIRVIKELEKKATSVAKIKFMT